MKSVVLTLAGLVAAAVAQDSLSECLQGCSQRMMSASKTQELGCGNKQGEDAKKCLCANPSFLYGFCDCAAEACTQDDGKKLVDMALNICKNAGVVIATSASGGASATGGSASASGGKATVVYSTYSSGSSVVSTPISTQTEGSEDDNSSSAGGAGGAAVAVTTYTSNGSVIVSTITSMASGSSSEGPSATGSSSASPTESNGASSSGSESQSSGSESGGGASQTGSSGSASSSSSAGPAPQITAAPAAGLLAADGVAALLI